MKKETKTFYGQSVELYRYTNEESSNIDVYFKDSDEEGEMASIIRKGEVVYNGDKNTSESMLFMGMDKDANYLWVLSDGLTIKQGINIFRSMKMDDYVTCYFVDPKRVSIKDNSPKPQKPKGEKSKKKK